MATDRWTILAVAATAVLLVLCLYPKSLMPPGRETPRAVPHADKVVHFAMFAAFGLAWARAGTPGRLGAGKAAAVLAVALVLAVGTEIAQGNDLIRRDPDPLDALADVVGSAFGVGLVAVRGASRQTLPGEET